MKLKHLKPFKEPPPPEREACAACKTFAPECLVPVEDEAVPMCWLCAHHVIEHDVLPGGAHCARCECTPQEIYPHRPAPPPPAPVADEPSPRAIEREKLLNSRALKIGAWVRVAYNQLSKAQLEAIRRKLS